MSTDEPNRFVQPAARSPSPDSARPRVIVDRRLHKTVIGTICCWSVPGGWIVGACSITIVVAAFTGSDRQSMVMLDQWIREWGVRSEYEQAWRILGALGVAALHLLTGWALVLAMARVHGAYIRRRTARGNLRRMIRAKGLRPWERRRIFGALRGAGRPCVASRSRLALRTTDDPRILILSKHPWTFDVQDDVQVLEGAWLMRQGWKRSMFGPDVGSLGVGLSMMSFLAGTLWRGRFTEWPTSFILGVIGFLFLKRFMIAAGLTPLGWFDARIDPGAIEFAGPFRTTRFPRQDTDVLILITGLWALVTLRRRDGATARLLLTHRGASVLCQVWCAPPRISRAV